MAYNLDCMADFGKAQTGLTVHGKLQDMSGALVGSAITSGIVESSVAPGQYLYTLSVADGFSGFFVMENSANAALRRTVGISPRETENSDVKTSEMATPANVTDAQTAITNAIAALNNLSESDLTDVQTAIIDAIAALNDLSIVQAQAAAEDALAAYDGATGADVTASQSALQTAIGDIPTTTEIVDAIKAYAVETGVSFNVAMQKIYAQVVGKSITDDPDDPTYFEYYAPDGTTLRLRHNIVNDTTREPA